MIRKHDFNAQQRELHDLMSDISEDCWCAGWLLNNEHTIWEALQGGDRTYGQGEIDAERLERIRALSAELDGWIVWIDDRDEPGMPVEQWGCRFVPLATWLEMVERLHAR